MWAGIVCLGEHHLRRGTWYRVVDAADPLSITIDINGTRAVIDRRECVIRQTRPMAWSVVIDGAVHKEHDAVYGVCPVCLTRAGLDGAEAERVCPGCGFETPIDWKGWAFTAGVRETVGAV